MSQIIKSELEDCVIDYPNSPNGEAYIGISKRPLMKNTEFKYGFQGVMLQDKNRDLLMCNSCGFFMKRITTKHLENCCGMTVQEYKKASGYYHSKGLVSDQTSLMLTRNIMDNDGWYSTARFTKEARRKNTEATRITKCSMEWRNKYGTCPKQLKARLKEFIICNRELPNQRNRGNSLYKSLCRHYGGFGKGLKKFGLPDFKRRGTNYLYTFPDGSKFAYNINQIDGREALFNMMIKKCPILS